MRVFLDTNVLVSAAATRGLCGDVLREVLVRHEVLVSPQVLKELRAVLKSKLRVPNDLIDDLIMLLQQAAVLTHAGELPEVRLRDKDDLPILGAALAGDADALVTGDKELLALGRIDNVEILSPRQFWQKLTASRRRQRKPRKR